MLGAVLNALASPVLSDHFFGPESPLVVFSPWLHQALAIANPQALNGLFSPPASPGAPAQAQFALPPAVVVAAAAPVPAPAEVPPAAVGVANGFGLGFDIDYLASPPASPPPTAIAAVAVDLGQVANPGLATPVLDPAAAAMEVGGNEVVGEVVVDVAVEIETPPTSPASITLPTAASDDAPLTPPAPVKNEPEVVETRPRLLHNTTVPVVIDFAPAAEATAPSPPRLLVRPPYAPSPLGIHFPVTAAQLFDDDGDDSEYEAAVDHAIIEDLSPARPTKRVRFVLPTDEDIDRPPKYALPRIKRESLFRRLFGAPRQNPADLTTTTDNANQVTDDFALRHGSLLALLGAVPKLFRRRGKRDKSDVVKCVEVDDDGLSMA